MGKHGLRRALHAAMIVASAAVAAPASAELAISQMIIELKPGSARTADVEIYNDSTERTYLSIEPAEIKQPGTPREERFTSPDPAQLSLLVSPTRMVLEPKQRRTLRIASLEQGSSRERIYRVLVKPVAGDVTGAESGLKLLVGYDLLVIARPQTQSGRVSGSRSLDSLVLSNDGNTSVELVDGKQCDAAGQDCRPLPPKRLYAGASWALPMKPTAKVEYQVRRPSGWDRLRF
jgi:Mat/Ecp fimbriae periplasmic chaperone